MFLQKMTLEIGIFIHSGNIDWSFQQPINCSVYIATHEQKSTILVLHYYKKLFKIQKYHIYIRH